MADQNTDRSKMSSGCFEKMPQIMRNMMSGKGKSRCIFTEKMAEMMPGCCPGQTQKASPADKPDQQAPK
ncbi:MAG: hypothetical protein ABSE08_14595 [Syntrophobacteraceae bacterium]|jgi:hypothetical protein